MLNFGIACVPVTPVYECYLCDEEDDGISACVEGNGLVGDILDSSSLYAGGIFIGTPSWNSTLFG